MEEQILQYFVSYGLPLGGIALIGVVILAILKGCNVFKNLAEGWRHLLYIVISFAFSLIASGIYLAATGQFTLAIFGTVALALYVLDQAVYATIKGLSLKEVFKAIGRVLFKVIRAVAVKLGIPFDNIVKGLLPDETPAEETPVTDVTTVVGLTATEQETHVTDGETAE